MVTQTGMFLWYNKWSILFVVVIFTLLMIYLTMHNIKFKEQKTKVVKEFVIEKMENQTMSPPDASSLNQEVENVSNNNSTCSNLKDKSGCTSLGSCVWASTTDKKTKINKCVAAVQLGSGSKAAKGSDGPSDICYCSKDGKLIPWEEYYYLDGSSIDKKNAKPCLAKGDKCTPKKTI